MLNIHMGIKKDISSKWMTELGTHLGFFRVVRLTDGCLHAVFRASTSHAGQPGVLYHTTSDDEGENWNEPTLLFEPDSGKDPRDPSLYLSPLNVLVLTFFLYDINTSKSDVHVWRAPIDNDTPHFPDVWRKYTFEPEAYSRNHTGIIPVDDGKFLLPIYAGSDGKKFNMYIYRTDGSSTMYAKEDWKLVYSNLDGTFDETTLLAEHSEESPKMKISSITRRNHQWAEKRYSLDNGTTWINDGFIKRPGSISGGQVIFNLCGEVYMIGRAGTHIYSPLVLMKRDLYGEYRNVMVIENIGSGYPSIVTTDDGFLLFYTVEHGQVARSKSAKFVLV